MIVDDGEFFGTVENEFMVECQVLMVNHLVVDRQSWWMYKIKIKIG